MPTLIYSPGVRIFVSTEKEGVIDVTDDIVNGNVTLNENGPTHRLNFTLANHRRKYDGVFTPNDRVSIQMKRLGSQWMQVMAGYLNEVPYFSIYPRVVPLSASCTMKRLQYWLWDPSTMESQGVLTPGWPGGGVPVSQELAKEVDGGMGTRMKNLLTKVGQWPEQNIHIGAIPDDWLGRVVELYETVRRHMVAVGVVAAADTSPAPVAQGTNPVAYGSLTVTGLSNLPTSTGFLPPCKAGQGRAKASYFAGVGTSDATGKMALTGEPGTNPTDPWYCAMRWPYVTWDVGTGAPKLYLNAAQTNAAKEWWKNRLILVTNPKNMQSVVLRAADWGPNAVTTDKDIDMSKHALETILGARTGDVLDVRFAPAGAQPGPFLAPTAAPTISAGPTSGPLAGTPAKATSADFVNLAMAQQGDAYNMSLAKVEPGNPDPNVWDCSSLVAWSAARLGVTLPRTAQMQRDHCRSAGTMIPVEDAKFMRGALLFHPGRGLEVGHVAISLGTGDQTIEAMGRNYGVVVGNIGSRFNAAALIPGLSYPTAAEGRSQVAATATAVAGSGGGATDGTYTSGSGPAGSIGLTSQWSPAGDVSGTSELLTGPRALLNDEPLLDTIQQFAKTSMRSFMAAPNGDFLAWFPDYFGHYGIAGRMKVEPLEIRLDGFSVQWADAALITHQYVVGAVAQAVPGGALSGEVDPSRMFETMGVASVEFPEIMGALLNMDKGDPGADRFFDAEKLLKRYGARRDFVESGLITQGIAEFWYAVYLFQRNWANQFTSEIQLTFMPELYPGMLLEIPDYKFQVYVTSVVHSFDFGGSGFTTNAYVCAPSSTDASGLFAMTSGSGS